MKVPRPNRERAVTEEEEETRVVGENKQAPKARGARKRELIRGIRELNWVRSLKGGAHAYSKDRYNILFRFKSASYGSLAHIANMRKGVSKVVLDRFNRPTETLCNVI